MAWENLTLEKQRLNLIEAFQSGNVSMEEICAKFGVSKKTGYKWYKRFCEQGENGLRNLSRKPHKLPYIFTDDQIERALDLKRKRLTWGPKKILAKLNEIFPEEEWPSPTRLYEIFKDYHLVTKKRIKPRVPATAPLGDLVNCNDTWAVDLKGWFLTSDGKKCEPLTITDCVSRYLITCTHSDRHSVEYIWPIFDRVFREYGLPNKIRSDNGPPFGSCGAGRLTKLSINLIKAGVTPEWINPGHPEENGRHERFHLTLAQEVANPPKETISMQIQSLKWFENDYNFNRPHEALNMKTPGAIYTSSNRKWNGILKPVEYDRTTFDVRKVEKSGQITWKGNHLFISETLQSEYVGLKAVDNDKHEVFFGPIYLGILDENGFKRPKLKTRRQR